MGMNVHIKDFFKYSLVLVFLISLAACAAAPEQPVETTRPTASATIEPASSATQAGSEEEQFVRTPTPAPTATPELLTLLVDQVVESVGLTQVRIFNLNIDDWINLALSLLIVFLSLFVIFRVLYFLLQRVVRLTPSPYDDLYLDKIRPYIRAFILLLGVEYAVQRLLFLNPFFKQLFSQITFAIFVYLAAVALWRLIDLFDDWYREVTVGHLDEAAKDAALMLTQRVLRGFVLLISAILVLDRFGINVTALLAALGIGGLALSLAAQDTLSNMISGIIILTDRPFLVGHRIEIQGLGTWGDVVSIGTRSTRIRTRDNRMVIVPNSILSGNQVVNYTYPDSQYRIQMELSIEYGQDVETVRALLIDTIRGVPGVLVDKPVDALYVTKGDQAMIFRVRWWLESYIDTRRMFDRVNTALQKALDEAGIRTPDEIQKVRVELGPEERELLGHSANQGN